MQEKIYYDADAVIKELMVLAKNREYVFRGYGKQNELYPNIIRDTDLRNREIELLIPYNLDKKKHKDILVKNTHLLKIHKSTRTALLDFLENIGIDEPVKNFL